MLKAPLWRLHTSKKINVVPLRLMLVQLTRNFAALMDLELMAWLKHGDMALRFGLDEKTDMPFQSNRCRKTIYQKVLLILCKTRAIALSAQKINQVAINNRWLSVFDLVDWFWVQSFSCRIWRTIRRIALFFNAENSEDWNIFQELWRPSQNLFRNLMHLNRSLKLPRFRAWLVF